MTTHDRGVRGRQREERQQEAQEAVRAHLQQHGRQDHGAGRGRLHVGVGQPGVEREERHLDREGQREAPKSQNCSREAQRHLEQVGVGERSARRSAPWYLKNR